MSNETTTFILDYAEVHRDFSLGDLFAYLQEMSHGSYTYKRKMAWAKYKG